MPARFLHGLHLSVSPGEFVVVHGAPGSGKSTLAGIAADCCSPTTGRRASTASRSRSSTRPSCAAPIRVVSEEPLLLAASLRDNLLLGAWGEITDDELVAALRTAGADEVVAEMEGGLDGSVGDRGLTVSGGQRQRISLARALVAKPRVLVLDDALSAVNPSLEIEIMQPRPPCASRDRDPLHHPPRQDWSSSPIARSSSTPRPTVVERRLTISIVASLQLDEDPSASRSLDVRHGRCS